MTPADIAREFRAWTLRNRMARDIYHYETTCPRCGGDSTPTLFRGPGLCPTCKESKK